MDKQCVVCCEVTSMGEECVCARRDKELPPAITRCVAHVSWNKYITPLPDCESCRAMAVLTAPDSTYNCKFALRQMMQLAEAVGRMNDRLEDLERNRYGGSDD